MKLFIVVFMAAFATVALTQGQSASADPSTTSAAPTSTSPQPPTSTSPRPPTSTPAPTTIAPTTPAPTTPAPTTPAPTTHAPTTQAPTSTTPPPRPREATLGNYTLQNAENKVCAVVLTKVIVTQNATSYPFVNGSLVKELSSCNDSQVTLWIESADGYKLQIVIEHDATNFYIGKLSTIASDLIADRDNLTQFSTPLKQFYKCASASQVSLEEEDVKIVFSEMKYQAFQKAETADFVGSQLECVSDYHSDVVIIAIGCALALLVVVILVAYLIARRKNRQRGYQSV